VGVVVAVVVAEHLLLQHVLSPGLLLVLQVVQVVQVVLLTLVHLLATSVMP
jgi:hypothetical protein